MSTTALTVHPDLNVLSAGIVDRAGTVVDPYERGWRQQRPYANGVVVFTNSGWLGNGFGTSTRKIAVNAEGQIVAVYWNEGTRFGARVIGHPDIYADRERDGRGGTYVTRTALSLWIEAVKGLGR